MKTITRFLCLTAAIALAIPAFAADFEGKVEMRIKSPEMAVLSKNSTMLMNFYAKGPKMRMDMKPDGEAAGFGAMMGDVFVLYDKDKKEITSIMPAMKMAMVMKEPEAKPDATTQADSPNAAFKATGKTDTILGYKAEEYVSTAETGEYVEMWVTKELGTFRMMQQQQDGKAAAPKGHEKFLLDNKLFPLKMTVYKKKGDAQPVVQLEVLKVDKSAQPDSLFQIPDGIKKMDMSKLQQDLEALKGLGE